IDLHSAPHAASPGEQGRATAASHRSADRFLSRRGRHRPHRGHLRPELQGLKRYDVVVIGGGAIGAAAAYFLRTHAKAGSVAVIERDPTYAKASTPRASGGVRRLFSLPENIRLSAFSIDFFKRFDETMAVDGEKAAIGFKQGGYLFIVPPEAMH